MYLLFLAALAVGLLSSADEIPGLLAAPTRFVPGLTTAERERARRDWGRALSRSQAREQAASFD